MCLGNSILGQFCRNRSTDAIKNRRDHVLTYFFILSYKRVLQLLLNEGILMP